LSIKACVLNGENESGARSKRKREQRLPLKENIILGIQNNVADIATSPEVMKQTRLGRRAFIRWKALETFDESLKVILLL
jgi:hypothetical protein